MTSSETIDVRDIFTSREFAKNPYPYYRQLRDESPIAFEPVTQSWLLSRYEDVEHALKDAIFTTRNYDWQGEPLHGRILLQMDGAEHATKRKLISPALRGRHLESVVPHIEAAARELIASWHGPEVDLVAEFTSLFPVNVIVRILGLPPEDRAMFTRWYESIVTFPASRAMARDGADLASMLDDAPNEKTALLIEAGLRTKRELAAYVLPIIAERRAQPKDDLLSTLAGSEIDGEHLTDAEITSLVSLVLAAGGETSDKAIASCFKQLALAPDQFGAVQADRSLVTNALAEALRLSPPVQWVMRQPSADVEFYGQVIPAGSTVTCLIASANRDERVFDRPDEFDVHREDLDISRAFVAAGNHFGFGSGRHFCAGAMLAKVEMEIAANMLLDALPVVELAPGFGEERGVFTRGPVSLKLKRLG